MIADFEQHLAAFIQSHSNQKNLSEVLLWSTLPAGKLFRPKIFYALLKDLNHSFDQNALNVAFALELHHAYTLVHDDLPCMDNDQYRRGKLTTHAKYGEWRAILAGDALLNLSYLALANVDHAESNKLVRLFAHNLGAQGLILGQWLDLEFDQKHYDNACQHIIHIHHLKTGQLFATALQSAALLSNCSLSFDKIAYSLGISFQLLDDLSELSETLSEHEKIINPFLLDTKNALSHLTQQLFILQDEVQLFPNLQNVIREYLAPLKNKISSVSTDEILNVVKIIENF
jgi:geranylgeranyl diphosphate synthase type II